jgi:hypothetical protein
VQTRGERERKQEKEREKRGEFTIGNNSTRGEVEKGGEREIISSVV